MSRFFILGFILGIAYFFLGCEPSYDLEAEQAYSDHAATQWVTFATAPAPIDGDFRDDSGNRARSNALTRPLFIFAYADFCGVCEAMRPDIVALEHKYWGQIEFLYLDRANTYENYEALLKYDIQSQPEFLVVKPNLEVISHWKGAPSLEALEAALRAVLADYPAN